MTTDEELVVHYKKLLEQYMKWLSNANKDREFWQGKYYGLKLENNALRRKVSKQYIRERGTWVKVSDRYPPEDNIKYKARYVERPECEMEWYGFTFKDYESSKNQIEWFNGKEGSKQEEVAKILDEMIRIDKGLYEKILDRDGFAYYFNELIKLAGGKK